MEMQPTGPRWEEVGHADIPPALAALGPALPETLFVLYDPRLRRYCFRQLPPTEDCGLMCFLTPEKACTYIEACLQPLTYDNIILVTLDQAHAMARERHVFVNCLILLDGTCSPSVHYVR